MGPLHLVVKSTSNPGYLIGGVLFLGLLKAIAEISLGVFLYGVCNKYKSNIGGERLQYISVLKYTCFILPIYIGSKPYGDSNIMITSIFLLFIGLYLTEIDTVSKIPFLNCKLVDYLGRLSLTIYMNNYYWSLIIGKVLKGYPDNFKLVVYLIVVALSSMLVLQISEILKKHFIL